MDPFFNDTEISNLSSSNFSDSKLDKVLLKARKKKGLLLEETAMLLNLQEKVKDANSSANKVATVLNSSDKWIGPS